jgi:hypothetical protein
VQIPADEAQEPLFTQMAEVATSAQTLFSIVPDPGPISAVSGGDDAPATQTGRRQDAESLQIPADPVDEPKVTREARDEMFDALGALLKARLGIAPDPRGNRRQRRRGRRTDADRTQTGAKAVLTDEALKILRQVQRELRLTPVNLPANLSDVRPIIDKKSDAWESL